MKYLHLLTTIAFLFLVSCSGGNNNGYNEYSGTTVESDPEIAEAERIIATPTLVKESPQPVQRIIGNLSDANKVLLALGLI